MQTAEQRLVERKEMRKARRKAKAFVKKVNGAQKRDGIREPGWPLDDTELVCEAFELVYALAGIEDC